MQIKNVINLSKCIIVLILLSGCGPTLFSVGVVDVTTGDVVVNGVKKKIIDEKKKSTTDSEFESSD